MCGIERRRLRPGGGVLHLRQHVTTADQGDLQSAGCHPERTSIAHCARAGRGCVPIVRLHTLRDRKGLHTPLAAMLRAVLLGEVCGPYVISMMGP